MSDASMASSMPLASPTARAGAFPIVFQSAGGWCFGWFHPARCVPRGTGVVLCRPFGYEAICSYRTYTVLAETLANGGFDVIRFDYHGTGDSAGADTDADRVPAWLASIASAISELRQRSGVSHVALFGMRLGATHAARAAAEVGGVDSLVLWAPCSGRVFTRELRAADAARGGAVPQEGSGIESLGYLYTAQTLRDLQALDRDDPAAAPARRVLIIGRDGTPASSALAERYREAGAETTCADWPGYAAMMVEPHEALIAHATLRAIAQWLGAPVTGEEPRTAPVAVQGPGDQAVASVLDGVREMPLAFGAERDLFGVLAEPVAPQLAERRAETAVLMLSVGGNHRIGPNRNYVRFARSLAAAGYRALRLDLAGVGDSRDSAGFSRASMYSRSSIADVRAAIDSLAERGCKRFYLLGICSGSYVAFQTAMVDARVTGQILMNPRLLEWEGKAGGWDDVMQTYYKSIAFYQRSLLNLNVYWRMARGQVDVNGIARRIRAVIQARLKRAIHRLLSWKSMEESLLSKFRSLGARGVDTLMVVGEEDDGRDYVEFHFGPRGRYLRKDPNFRMVMVPDADHTFSRSRSQQFVLAAVREHLDTQTSSTRELSQVYLKDPKMVRAG
ncbi:MAG: alpha/beta fold hydrolase [Ramlibacter sp.]